MKAMQSSNKPRKNKSRIYNLQFSVLDKLTGPAGVSIAIGTGVLCCGGLLGGIVYQGDVDGDNLEKKSKAVCDYGSPDNWYGLPDDVDEDSTLDQLRSLGYGGHKPLELGMVSCNATLSLEDRQAPSLVTVKQETWAFDARKACMTFVLSGDYKQPSQPNQTHVVCSAPLTGSP